MESYKQSVPAIGVSLERGTANVPRDGYFYVLVNGEIRGRFRGMRRALAFYKSLLEQSGYTPPSTERAKADPAREAVERYMDELEAYWGESHRHTRRGGKTMYRG
jgi:predicted DNA-binding protein